MNTALSKVKKIPREVILIFILFCLTRLILIAIGIFTNHTIGDTGRFDSPVFPYTEFEWLNIWGHWDTGWYMRIARDWYTNNVVTAPGSVGQNELVFFPLYPSLVRILGRVIQNYYIAGIVISNASVLLSAYFLYKIVTIDEDKETGFRAIKYLFILPFAFLFSSVLTESTYLLMVLISYYFAKKNNWAMAGLFGLFCALTRSVGFFLIIPLLIEYLRNKDYQFNKIKWDIAFLGLILIGFSIILLFNNHISGDAFSFMRTQAAWGRSLGNPFGYLWNAIFHAPSLFEFFSGLITLLAIILLIFFYKYFSLPEFIFILYSILIPLSTGIVSMPRYLLVIFPFIILFARLGKKKAIDDGLTISFAMVQVFAFIFWVLGTYLII